MKLLSGHEVREPPQEEQEKQKKLFAAYTSGVITLHPGNWFYLKPFLDVADKLYTFKFRPTDTLIMNFPKCGTTWMQEIIWNMKYPSNLDDFSDVSINTRCTLLDGDFVIHNPYVPPPTPDSDLGKYLAKYCPGIDPKDGMFIPLANNIPDPRVMKTHLPFSLLTPNMLDTCKVVFVVRNPKDVCLSFYHHSRLIRAHYYTGDFETFLDLFLDDKVLYAPYWKHLEEGYDHQNHPNFHLVHFEDLKADPLKEITRLNSFLQTELSLETIKKVVEGTTFKKMKERDPYIGRPDSENLFIDSKLGSFFRKGDSGTWKQEFTDEQSRRLDEWSKKHMESGKVIIPKFI